MTERYPFFRDEDERTRAVIGEEDAQADLAGQYRKPYAVLTQRRLYCKNETGNFITEGAAIRSAGMGTLPGQNWPRLLAMVCLSLTVLLGLWYWWTERRGWMGYQYVEAQDQIDRYLAMEAEQPEYEAQLARYDQAQAQLRQSREALDGVDAGLLREIDARQADLEEARQEKEAIRADITAATSAIGEYTRRINSAEYALEHNKNEQLQVQLDDLAAKLEEEEALYQEVLDSEPFDVWRWGFMGVSREEMLGICQRNMEQYYTQINRLRSEYVDVDQLRAQIEEDRQASAGEEARKAEYQRQLAEAEERENAALERVEEYRAEIDQMEAWRATIEACSQECAGIDQETLQQKVQEFRDLAPEYRAARQTQLKLTMFFPCLVAFAASCGLFLALVCLRRERAQAAAVWLPVLLGGLFAWSAGVEPAVAGPLCGLVAAAALGAVLMRWWRRARTRFRIVHTAGSFSFLPSQYPAGELKEFEAQVEQLLAGERDG